MVTLRPIFLLFATLLASSPIHAQEPLPLASGWWEVITQPDFKNIPAFPTPKTSQICLSDDAIKSGKIDLQLAASCKVTGGQWNKNLLTLNIFCPSEEPPEIKVPAELNAAGTAFTSHIQFNPQIGFRHSGKWLAAECP